MNVTLYQAAEQVRELLDQIDPETGEMPEGFEGARALVETKSRAVAAFILDTEAQADMIEAHGKTLIARAKAARKRTDWLRQYLKTHMQAADILSIKSEDGTFSAKLEKERDESVDVFEPGLLPQDYMREIPAKYEPDKALIKKAIKDGFEVPGARIVKNDRLTIK